MIKILLCRLFTVVFFAGFSALTLIPTSSRAAAAFVQQASGAAPGSTQTFSVSFSSKTTAGNLILVGFDKDGSQIPTVTDSQGNTFTEIGNELTSPVGSHSRLYCASNIHGGADSVTVTYSASSTYLELYVTEYSGINTTNPIDGQSGNSGSAGAVTSKSVTTTTAGDIIYGWSAADWACTVGSGFSARATLNNNLVEDMTSGGAGAYAATATANNGWTMQMVALRPASTSDTTPPSVPANLTATAVSPTSVAFSWTASTDNVGVTGYKIYRGGAQIGTSTGTSYTDTGLTASTAYSYTVSAYDAAGNNSAQSTALAVTTKASLDTTPPVVAITSPANNATVSGIVTVSGTASDNVAVAATAVSIDGGPLVATAGTTSWTFSTNSLSLANGAHTIAGVATDTSGNRATNTISVTVNNDTTPPSVPASLAVTAVSQTNVTFTWTASTDNVGVTGYKIYRGGTQIGTSTGTSYTDTGLTASTAYSYTVSAYDAAGNNSAQSTALAVTTKASLDTTPPVVSITSPANNATVSGIVTVSGTASDNIAVAATAVSIDGGPLVATAGTTSWTFSTNSLSLANGSHAVAAVATDSSGNRATNTISVTVNNPDVVPPTVPTNVSVTSLTSFTASLSWTSSTDNVGVAGYQVFRNGTKLATTHNPAYADTGLTASTTYNYTVTAFDAAGNVSAQSTALVVTTLVLSKPAGSPVYPLKISSDGRSMVDQNGNPFFIVGDSPWSLANEVSNADVVTYLSDRESRGFNAIWMGSADNVYQTNPPDDYYGNPPFDGPDFTSEDPAYWAHLDYVIEQAASCGISVWLSPAFVGLASADGYLASYQNSSDAVLTAYGAWLGNRYKNFPNIVWVLGGDADPTAAGLYQKIADIGSGIRSADTNHLITMEASRFTISGQTVPDGGYSSVQAWLTAQGSVPPWLNLNWVYPPPADEASNANTNYNLTPFLPPLLGEDWYEGEHSMTELALRTEGYSGILSGAYLGRFFGNDQIWTFGNTNFEESPGITWQAALGSEGSVEQSIAGKLFYSREFWKMVPDIANTVLTAGYQSGTTLAVASRTSDGNTVIAYLPTQRTVTVNLTAISGSQAMAWWFNPRTGTSTVIGTYSTSGSQNFTPPDTNDWVLVLDNAALGLGSPGTSTVDTTPPSQPAALAVTATSASTVSLSWAASTDNVGVTGYQIFRNGVAIGTSTTTNFTDTGLTSATTYTYTVSAYDAAGNKSAQSSAIQATTANAPPPTAPTNLTITGSTPTSVSFAWSPSTSGLGVAGYQIFRNGLSIATTTNTAFVDANIIANTAYTYGLSAYDTAGNVSPQSTWQFSIQWNIP